MVCPFRDTEARVFKSQKSLRERGATVNNYRGFYEAGATVKETAQRFGVSTGKMHKLLIFAGTNMRPRGVPKREKKPKPPRVLKINHWSKREIDILIKLYPTESIEYTAKVLGRSVIAVRHKAVNLGIKRDPRAEYQTRSAARRGELTHNYKGYKRKTSGGYVVLYKPEFKGARKDGLIMEHRYVMSLHIGRPIRKDEAVHHINGNKTDNRIENLLLMTHGEHSAMHNRERKRA